MTKTLKTERQVMMLAMAATLIAMTRLEYNQFRGWTLPADEDGEDEGFLVNFGFHTAWWPKDVVDKHFVALPPAPPHQQRVHVEALELRERVQKLKACIGSDLFTSLVPDEQLRLTRQYNLQCQLLQVLDERIANFN